MKFCEMAESPKGFQAAGYGIQVSGSWLRRGLRPTRSWFKCPSRLYLYLPAVCEGMQVKWISSKVGGGGEGGEGRKWRYVAESGPPEVPEVEHVLDRLQLSFKVY